MAPTGVAAHGSPFDPVGSTPPPDGKQYALMQPAHGYPAFFNVTTLPALTLGRAYNLSWYVATRATSNPVTSCTLQAYVGQELVYTSAPDVADSYGSWSPADVQFVASSTTTTLSFVATPEKDDDQTVLIDFVMLTEV